MAVAASPSAAGARQARDIMALGQQVGRVLSDGRVVGRREPFAKVFATSREVKKAVGAVAWVVLEDIALDADIDADGRLVAETNVRRIAANLAMSKTTVHKHLVRLRDFGFVLHEERRDDASGRYEFSRYVIDPSACVERFRRAGEPCTGRWDTAATVSQSTGHGGVVQNNRAVVALDPGQEQQPPRAGDVPDRELLDALTAVGVSVATASELLVGHPEEQVRDALTAVVDQPVRNPAGWVVTAIRAGWDLSAHLAEQRKARQRRDRDAAAVVEAEQAAAAERERAARSDAWAAAVSEALDDEQLAQAVRQVTSPVPGLQRRSVPHARGQLLTWAVAVHVRSPEAPLSSALGAALAADSARVSPRPLDDDLPTAPRCLGTARNLDDRLRHVLGLYTARHQAPRPNSESDGAPASRNSASPSLPGKAGASHLSYLRANQTRRATRQRRGRNNDYVRKLASHGAIPAHRLPQGRATRFLRERSPRWLRTLPGPDRTMSVD